MSAPIDNASESYYRTLEILGRGDRSGAVRSLQDATVELCTHFDESGRNWQGDDDSYWPQEILYLCAAHIAPGTTEREDQIAAIASQVFAKEVAVQRLIVLGMHETNTSMPYRTFGVFDRPTD